MRELKFIKRIKFLWHRYRARKYYYDRERAFIMFPAGRGICREISSAYREAEDSMNKHIAGMKANDPKEAK